MRVDGLKVDREKYFNNLPILENEIVVQNEILNRLAGRVVKPNSTKDVVTLLFEELGLPETPIKTSKGAQSVNAESLSFLEGNEVVDAITATKKASSEYSGSVKLQTFLDESDRIHPEFLQIGYADGTRVYTTGIPSN